MVQTNSVCRTHQHNELGTSTSALHPWRPLLFSQAHYYHPHSQHYEPGELPKDPGLQRVHAETPVAGETTITAEGEAGPSMTSHEYYHHSKLMTHTLQKPSYDAHVANPWPRDQVHLISDHHVDPDRSRYIKRDLELRISCLDTCSYRKNVWMHNYHDEYPDLYLYWYPDRDLAELVWNLI